MAWGDGDLELDDEDGWDAPTQTQSSSFRPSVPGTTASSFSQSSQQQSHKTVNAAADCNNDPCAHVPTPLGAIVNSTSAGALNRSVQPQSSHHPSLPSWADGRPQQPREQPPAVPFRVSQDPDSRSQQPRERPPAVPFNFSQGNKPLRSNNTPAETPSPMQQMVNSQGASEVVQRPASAPLLSNKRRNKICGPAGDMPALAPGILLSNLSQLLSCAK